MRIASAPWSAALIYRPSGSGEGSVASAIAAGKHRSIVDEPAARVGNYAAASPVEFALGALIACQIDIYRLYANALGFQLDGISIDAEGALDVRNLFGSSDEVRPGFSTIRFNIRQSSAQLNAGAQVTHCGPRYRFVPR